MKMLILGVTVLGLAIVSMNEEAIAQVVENNSQILSAKATATNYEKFYQLSQNRKTKKLAKFLLDKPQLDINRGNTEGVTALMFAADKRRNKVVKLLLEAGADPNAQDKYGDTPLIYALKVSMLKWSDGGNWDVINELLDAGADINDANYAGLTPFMLVSKEYSLKHMKFLSQKGANVYLLDKTGSNARDMFNFAIIEKPWVKKGMFNEVFDQHDLKSKNTYKGYIPYGVNGKKEKVVERRVASASTQEKTYSKCFSGDFRPLERACLTLDNETSAYYEDFVPTATFEQLELICREGSWAVNPYAVNEMKRRFPNQRSQHCKGSVLSGLLEPAQSTVTKLKPNNAQTNRVFCNYDDFHPFHKNCLSATSDPFIGGSYEDWAKIASYEDLYRLCSVAVFDSPQQYIAIGTIMKRFPTKRQCNASEDVLMFLKMFNAEN